MNKIEMTVLGIGAAGIIGGGHLIYENQNTKGNYKGDNLCKYDEYSTNVKHNIHNLTIPNNEFKISDKGLVKYELANKFSDGQLTIFFRTNSDTLYKNDLEDIKNFFKNVDKDTKILLEGYSDSRGNKEDNLKLAESRILGIKNLLEKEGYNNIQLINYGENNTTNKAKSTRGLTLNEKLELRKDRKVDIKIKTNVIESGLNKFPADIYLLDFSGSMKGEKEEKVKEYNFNNQADIYGFNSEMNKDNCSLDLKNQISTGDTPLWDSLYKLMEKSEKNKTITILTDGEDTRSLKNIDDVIELANKKGIILNFISIGNQDDNLKEISKKTKGGFYFINN